MRLATACLSIVIGVLACFVLGGPFLSAAGMPEDCSKALTGFRPLAALQLHGRDHVASEPGIRIDVNVKWLFPDSYVRTDNMHFSDGVVSFISGFDRDHLLNRTVATGPGQHFGSSWGPEQLPIERRQSAMMLLGLLGWATNVSSVERSSPRASTHTAAAVAIRLEDRDLILDLDSQCLPVEMTYRAAVHLPRPGVSLTTPPPPTMSDVTITYSDRRPVQGYRLPFTIVTHAAGIGLERLRVLNYQVRSRSVSDRNQP